MFKFFKSKPVQVFKESAVGRLIFLGSKAASWSMGSKSDYKAYAMEGYCQNVVVYQAINKKAQALGAIPLYVTDARGNELTDSPLLQLVNNPNPRQTKQQFFADLAAHLDLSGNSYIERINVGGRTRELYALRPDRMRVNPGITGLPSGYTYKVNEYDKTWPSDPVSGASDIRHIKTFNPLDDWYGMSAISSGAFAVDQHNETMRSMQAILQNNMTPSGVLQIKDSLTDDQFIRLKADIDDKYTGSGNKGRPLLLENGATWQQIGISPHDAMLIETKYSSARDISLALGVPPLMLNIQGDSTYSNYKEARLAFYEETIMPLATWIIDELNAWLSPMFGGHKLHLDFDQIPAIAEKRAEVWAMAAGAQDLTINERRALRGYDEIEGGDVLMVSSGMIPLSMAIEDPVVDDDETEEESDLTGEDMKAILYGTQSVKRK